MSTEYLDILSSTALANLARRFWAFRCHEEPLLAIQAGARTGDAVLFREAPQDFERRFALAGGFLNELAAIPESGLTTQDWATHRLLRRELEDIRSFHEVKAHHRPALFPLGPESLAIDFANSVTLTTLGTAEAYLDRLKTVPDYFSDVMDTLSSGHAAGFRYPQQVIASAAAAVCAYTQGVVEDFAWLGPFRRTSLSGPELDCLALDVQTLVVSKLVPAMRAYADFLKGPLSLGAHHSVSCSDSPLGAEFYRTLIRHFTTTDLTALELHELGKAEVSRLTREMQAVAAEAGFDNDLRGYRAFLTTDRQFFVPSKEVLREQFEVLSNHIQLKVPALFGKAPRATFEIRSIPERVAMFLPPAYAQPNPADCSGPGVYWVTSLPTRAPTFMHIPLTLHEAWPGHLMHMALIQEATALPAFRRFALGFGGAWRYSACLEGWSLYCEELGLEMGLYGTPDQHYGRLEMEMWRALRLVVDTGLHSQNWTRTQAIEYMAAHQVLARATIESEVDRYIGMPAQALAYQVGKIKFRELRQSAERRLGSRFNVRDYHDQLMTAGPVTLPVLDRLVEGYVSRNAKTP